jgi:4-amino-4-deoxy-L-arabinose transferase-like glycosyltransferase
MPDNEESSSLRNALIVIGMTLLLVLPTLGWLEFSSGSENLVVGAALETARNGNWIEPTLMGEPRIKKPPLVTWIAAASMLPVDTGQIATREHGDRVQQMLQWSVRLPLLAVTAVTLLATWMTAALVLSKRDAWIAVAVLASNYLFLRFARNTTTDIYLLMFVAIANAALARLLLAKPTMSTAVVAGLACGLAFMTKGPVMIVQTFAPWLAMIAFQRRSGLTLNRVGLGKWSAVAVFTLLVGLPWYAMVISRNPHVWSTWFSEVSRHGATNNQASFVLKYAGLPLFMFPWTALFVVGLIACFGADRRRWPNRWAALWLLLLPLVVMSLVPDRKERYLLPMLVPASLVAAFGASLLLERLRSPGRLDRLASLLHWSPLAIVVLAIPVVGLVGVEAVRRVDGTPWYSVPFAATAILVPGLLVAMSIARCRHKPAALVFGTVGTMLFLQIVVMQGYRDSREGRNELRAFAETIVRERHAATWYHVSDSDQLAPADLGIYSNRVVRRTARASDIPRSPGGEVLLLRQRKRDAEPTPPEGFTFLLRGRRDDNWWWAFERPASEK